MAKLKEPMLLTLKEENGIFTLEGVQHGRTSKVIFDKEKAHSLEWKHLRELSQSLNQAFPLPFSVYWGGGAQTGVERGSENKSHFLGYEDFYKELMARGRKGIYIQRYKGLGEMNPEQLWETTLNAQNRRLIRVTIEDSVKADEIFSVLMGEMVEPRKQFIYDNALFAGTLDI